jgi:hypothetical protein
VTLLEELLLAISLSGTVSLAESCAFRSSCLKGIVACCAKHAKHPIDIAKPSIVFCNVFMMSSIRAGCSAGFNG